MHTKRMIVGTAATMALFGAMAVPAFAASVYPTGTSGYDISYNATSPYPSSPFGFGVVGVTHGKAFTYNNNLTAEFSWASQGSATGPTLYMNLNAPVGTTAKTYESGPIACPKGKAGGICQAHNYGWNAAQDAFNYATVQGAKATTWWLDIETANSWSGNLSTNQATIQGAIDFLHSENVTVGAYSTPGMWNAIVGSWAPSIPEWLADGNNTQAAASSACSNTSFTGIGIWLVQFINKATSPVDQDYSC